MTLITKSFLQYFSVFFTVLILAGCNASATLPYTNVDNDELKTLLDQGATLVDIRRPEEWKQTGVVEGSNTLTFFFASGRVNPQFIPKIQDIAAKDKPLVLICRTGNRTRAASEFLAKEMGYTQVYNVKHGITSWIAEKRPVVAAR